MRLYIRNKMTNCTYVKEYVRIISIVKYQTCGGVGVVAEAEKLVRTEPPRLVNTLA